MLIDLVRLAQGGDRDQGDEPFSPQNQTWSSAFLRTNMVATGWCPQHVDFLFQRNGAVMMVYLARLPRANPSGIVHTRCTNLKCIGGNAELNGTYRHRHIKVSCTCNAVFADSDAVRAVIREGVPLVSIDVGSVDSSLRLLVSRATSFSKYTAISHVWADGLGNPSGNGLPGDDDETLAVGIPGDDDEEVNRLKVTAINAMARIYACARQVLVLDAEPQSHAISSYSASVAASQDEIMAWVATATWMRRSWTLHEGALGRRVWFQFMDVAVNCRPHERSEVLCSGGLEVLDLSRTSLPSYLARITRLWPLSRTPLVAEVGLREHPLKAMLRDSWRTSVYQTLELLGYGFIKRDWSGRATSEGLFVLFCLIWQELIPRNTTKAEDLPIIFASLLDFKAHEILQVDSEHRMLAMLGNIPLIPQELLFNRGARLRPSSKHKNRWVPITTSRQSIVPGNAPIVSRAAPGLSRVTRFIFSRRPILSTPRSNRLKWDENGKSLLLKFDTIFVLSTLPRAIIRDKFVLSVPNISASPRTSETVHFRVDVDRAEDDAIDLAGVSRVAFLISRDWKRGCIILLTDCEETFFGIEVIHMAVAKMPYTLPPISAILFAIDRQREPGYYGFVETTCIIMHALGCYLVAAVFLIVASQVVSRLLKGLYYMYWVRSFTD
ncbi:hypothetical protein B0I35DRAFT_515077 [Stachybotrys elegans]|uniref:Heterokaryon incompatibility domain-containing protein n=1 Tax=Stachybotrys elegans TaxID=80388 RepID=A0A8K0SNM0_9HYPO|nr:hypothetical protein B0I35DRAFT_515077 [Stachybotrys elegans]